MMGRKNHKPQKAAKINDFISGANSPTFFNGVVGLKLE
jgi:hypothetical protein